MAFIHGRVTVFSYDNAAGALQDLSAYSPKADFSRAQDLLDVTTFGQTSKAWLAGYKDGDDITIEFIYDPTLESHLRLVMNLTTGATQTYAFGPEGSASGKVRYTGESLMLSYKINAAVGAATTVSLTIRKTGAVTTDTWP
jgi:hypothetical protein